MGRPEQRREGIEGKEAGRLKVEAGMETFASSEHGERNEDAALGDVSRLREEMQAAPKLETKDPVADAAAVRGALERELRVAEKLKDKKVFGVLDGISGGREGGGTGVVASRLASARLSERLSEMPDEIGLEDAKRFLAQAMKEADAEIRAYRDQATAAGGPDRQRELKQMGTTATIVKMLETPDGKKHAVIGTAGDSRVYRYDAKTGQVQPLTVDENIVGFMLRSGRINRQEYDMVMAAPDAESLPQHLRQFDLGSQSFDLRAARNTIYNSLGSGNEPQIGDNGNVFSVELNPGDRLLLSSDGVHDNLTDTEIARLMQSGANVNQIARDARAVNRKPDDITATMIEVGAEAPPGPEQLAAAQVDQWKQEAETFRSEIGRLEKLIGDNAAADTAMRKGHEMMGFSMKDIQEFQRLGGEAGVRALIRQYKMESLSREYRIAQEKVNADARQLGMEPQQVLAEVAKQRQVRDWQKKLSAAARTMTVAARGVIPGVDRNALDAVYQMKQAGQSPEDIMRVAKETEAQAAAVLEALEPIAREAERAEGMGAEWHRLDGERKQEMAARETQARAQAEQAAAQVREQLMSAPGPGGSEARPAAPPSAAPQKKKGLWGTMKGWFGR